MQEGEYDEFVFSYITESNDSCYEPSRTNLTYHWGVLYSPDYVGKAGTIPLIIIFLTGVPLNLYIIIAMIYKRLYTQPTYLLLLNLGLSDLITCFVPLLFGIITGLIGEVGFGDNDYIRCQICKISAGYILVTFSHSYSVVVLSLERLAFFVSPLRYKNSVTARRTVVVVVIIWLMSIGFTVPPLFGYGDLLFGMWCGIIFVTQPHVLRSLVYLALCAVNDALCMALLVMSNVWIGYIAIKSMRKMKKISITPNRRSTHIPTRVLPARQRNRSIKKRRRITVQVANKQLRFFQIFGCILAVNVITKLPAFYLIVVSIIDITAVHVEVLIFVQVTQLLQVVLHPVLETFISPELRRIIASHGTLCCPKDTVIGNCFSKAFTWLGKCCRLNLWAKALEEEIWNMKDFMHTDIHADSRSDLPSLATDTYSNLPTSSVIATITDSTINQLPVITDLPTISVDFIDMPTITTDFESNVVESSNFPTTTTTAEFDTNCLADITNIPATSTTAEFDSSCLADITIVTDLSL
jgi:hypothetical protein